MIKVEEDVWHSARPTLISLLQIHFYLSSLLMRTLGGSRGWLKSLASCLLGWQTQESRLQPDLAQLLHTLGQ